MWRTDYILAAVGEQAISMESSGFFGPCYVFYLPGLWSAWKHMDWTWRSVYTSGLASLGLVRDCQPSLISSGLVPIESLLFPLSYPWPSKSQHKPAGAQSSCFELLLLRSETFLVLSSIQAKQEKCTKGKFCLF